MVAVFTQDKLGYVAVELIVQPLSQYNLFLLFIDIV